MNQLAQYLAMYDKQQPGQGSYQDYGPFVSNQAATQMRNSNASNNAGARMNWAQNMTRQDEMNQPPPDFFGSQQQPSYVQPQQFEESYRPAPPIGDYSAVEAAGKRYQAGMMPQIQNYLAKLLGGR